ncbi:MAG: type II toxin-antitoxin system VapC family toxin [Verrucomicrobia bacterium]|nr:type II toxin-antitoxin system VapC family toxin [Verrucomicrobiota bacterium]
MIFVDTGFLLAFAQPTDALHHRARAWAASLEESFVLTEYVLWEVVNNLSMPADRQRARRIVNFVISDPAYEMLSASRRFFQAGLEIHSQRPDKEWSLTDCISFHVMRERGITKALAYDRHFEQAGFEALLRREPPAED